MQINLDVIKKKLLDRKNELEDKIAHRFSLPIADADAKDLGDQATAASLEELTISLRNNEMNEYAMVSKALEMIEKGTYGICVDCNNPISERRLALYPNATRCIACQEAREGA